MSTVFSNELSVIKRNKYQTIPRTNIRLPNTWKFLIHWRSRNFIEKIKNQIHLFSLMLPTLWVRFYPMVVSNFNWIRVPQMKLLQLQFGVPSNNTVFVYHKYQKLEKELKQRIVDTLQKHWKWVVQATSLEEERIDGRREYWSGLQGRKKKGG